jgi:hypothetical protein
VQTEVEKPASFEVKQRTCDSLGEHSKDVERIFQSLPLLSCKLY